MQGCLGRQVSLDGVAEVVLAGGLFRREGSLVIDVQFSPALCRLGNRQRSPGLRQLSFGLIEDTSHSPVRDKKVRRQQMVDRALAAIADWKEATARRVLLPA